MSEKEKMRKNIVHTYEIVLHFGFGVCNSVIFGPSLYGLGPNENRTVKKKKKKQTNKKISSEKINCPSPHCTRKCTHTHTHIQHIRHTYAQLKNQLTNSFTHFAANASVISLYLVLAHSLFVFTEKI